MSVSKATVVKTKANYSTLLASVLPVGADVAAYVAVIAVEAGSGGIDLRYNRPIIRFEVHKFYDSHGVINRAAFDAHFKFNRQVKYKDHYYTTTIAPTTWIKLHEGTRDQAQIHEWYALDVAMQLDNRSQGAAIESASWGAGQIMGFHWKALGYADAFSFMRAAFDPTEQIRMLVKFIALDPRLTAAVAKKDWAAFALHYNGSGQVATYSEWLAQAYEYAK
jgi:N-acetylmuramidase-like protein